MALASAPPVDCAAYQPRAAETGVLHAVIREHLEDFLRLAAERTEGTGVPSFVEREFRQFLSCGVLARGFARVRCPGCAFERLVPFSCKGPQAPASTEAGRARHWTWANLMRRAFDIDVLACPRCGGRMTLIATIEDPHVIRRILSHLRLPTEMPQPHPSRPPPSHDLFGETPA